MNTTRPPTTWDEKQRGWEMKRFSLNTSHTWHVRFRFMKHHCLIKRQTNSCQLQEFLISFKKCFEKFTAVWFLFENKNLFLLLNKANIIVSQRVIAYLYRRNIDAAWRGSVIYIDIIIYKTPATNSTSLKTNSQSWHHKYVPPVWHATAFELFWAHRTFFLHCWDEPGGC